MLDRDNYDLGSLADLAGSIPMVLKAEQRSIGMELAKGSGGKVACRGKARSRCGTRRYAHGDNRDATLDERYFR